LYQRQHVSSRHLEQLSKDTTRVAHQNLYGSMMWHLLLTPLAALGYVQPWLAAITMLVSSLAVAVNALRLYRRQSYELAHVWAGGPAGSRLG
jgi:cation transport ATPase